MGRIARKMSLAVMGGAALCLVISATPAVALTEPTPGAAGWMYEAGTVTAIDLTLSPAEKSKLEAEPFEYVKGSFSLAKTDGAPGGAETPVVTSLPVEIRLKGNIEGSFRELDEKAAFKLKFKKAEAFLGLRKMTLNNMVEDYSLIHETLAYRAFRAAGVAAPRTGFAFVRLNGEDFGIYLNLENLDKVNLERWFGLFDDPQHLYEGEYGTDVKPGEATKFEVDEGDEVERADLDALIAAANASEGAGWSNQVAPVADLAEMTRMWAVEKYIGHWDGYSGRVAPKQPNNYYLYSSPAGVFQMLPWGTDLTWMQRLSFDGPGGLLFNKCLADPACASLYRQELRSLGKVIAGLDLGSLGVSTAKLLAPWEQADPRLEHPELIEDAVAESLAFVADRPAELAAFLGPEESLATSSGNPGGQLKATAPSLYVGRSRRDAGALVTHLWLAGPGVVSQTATIKTAQGPRSVCSARATVPSAGPRDLRCPLSALLLRRLRLHGLTLRVHTDFVPQGGNPNSTFHRVHLTRVAAR